MTVWGPNRRIRWRTSSKSEFHIDKDEESDFIFSSESNLST